MNEDNAEKLAADMAKLLITHHPSALSQGGSPLSSEVQARQFAQSIAAFRQELIVQLMRKP